MPRTELASEITKTQGLGKTAYQAQQYEEALGHYQQALTLTVDFYGTATFPGFFPRATLHHNIARCYEKLGKNAERLSTLGEAALLHLENTLTAKKNALSVRNKESFDIRFITIAAAVDGIPFAMAAGKFEPIICEFALLISDNGFLNQAVELFEKLFLVLQITNNFIYKMMFSKLVTAYDDIRNKIDSTLDSNQTDPNVEAIIDNFMARFRKLITVYSDTPRDNVSAAPSYDTAPTPEVQYSDEEKIQFIEFMAQLVSHKAETALTKGDDRESVEYLTALTKLYPDSSHLNEALSQAKERLRESSAPTASNIPAAKSPR